MKLKIDVEKYAPADLPAMFEIWNAIVRDGNAFPQEDELGRESGAEFFGAQSHCGVARVNGEIVGLYILHPNNVGRCGHICNASYAVAQNARGKGVGEALVRDSLEVARHLGFRLMQFNAVVAGNQAAHRLYDALGFQRLGVAPGGFRHKDGHYEDIVLYCRQL